MGENKHDEEQDRFEKYLDAVNGNPQQTTLFAVLKDAGIDLPNPLLLEDHPVVPDGFPVTTHLDVLGGWSEDDIEAFLRYHADEDDRKTWREEFGKTLPEHVDPPYERDRFLPGH
jgi:hypothetical protein